MGQLVQYNGATIEFPDGMSPAEMTAVLKANALSLPSKAAAQIANDPITMGARNFAMQDMDGTDRVLAGMGKAFTDVGRGLGQFVPGLVTSKDVAESRRLDAPLMKTTGGKVGHFAGTVAALTPLALVPGANTLAGAGAIGAFTGLAQPSTSTGETLRNTAFGALAGPAAQLALRGGLALYQGAKGLIEPLTQSGQERMAAEVIRRSATDPARASQMGSQAGELVPGSQPTLAQATGDAGLAQLERTILNNPEYAGALQQRYAAQRAARLKAVQDVAGTPDYYEAIKAGRQVFAREDYGRAMAQGIDQEMATALKPQIQALMERPSIQQAQRAARNLAAENGQKIINFGSLEGLDWLKKALDNQISKASVPGSSIGKEELRALTQTKGDLMATIEQIAPGYKAANDAYSAMSRQINGMDVARSLLDKLHKPGSEYAGASAREMGDAYMRALSQAQESVKKATGLNRGISDVMGTGDIAALENVARDLGRKSFVETAGRALGSPTAQNLASQNLLRRVLGPAGLPESWAESVMLQGLLSPVQVASKLSGADRRVMERITRGLLDPADGLSLLSTAAKPQAGLLAEPAAQRLALPAGLLAVNGPNRQ